MLLDNFEQEITAGAKCVFANKRSNSPASLEICTVDSITDKGTIKLIMADGTKHMTSKNESLCIVDVIDKQPEVGDYVIAAIQLLRNQYMPYLYQIVKFTPKKVTIRRLVDAFVMSEYESVTLERVHCISEQTMHKLKALLEAQAEYNKEEARKLFDDVE